MLSWWTKNSLHSINIRDIVAKVLSLCSVYQAQTYESGLTFPVEFLTELAYLSMIFILEMQAVQTISRISEAEPAM